MPVNKAKVNGETIEMALNGVMSVFRERLREAFEERGIHTIEEEEWYPIEDFTAVLEIIEENAGESTLRKLGVVVAENIDWETRPSDPTAALNNISKAMSTCHRGSIGDYEFKETGASSGEIVCKGPYPCTFDKGIVKGTAERYGASYAKISEQNGPCRETGGHACTYEVEW
jgi:hypothetical protein